jgi:hypothetical protein
LHQLRIELGTYPPRNQIFANDTASRDGKMAIQNIKSMKVCVIGAGSYLIIRNSKTSNLGFVGAGIQLAPNMSRILDRLGVWKEIEAEAVILRETSIRGMSFLFSRADLVIRSQRGLGLIEE